MDFIITNKNGKPLSGFYPNDLPVTRSGRFTPSRIFAFLDSKQIRFSSEQRAVEYAHYMRSQLNDSDNRDRYEEACPGSTDRLERVLASLSIVKLD